MSVSVIVPTWNRAAKVELAIRSVLSQTHAPLEVLVCDDGSTDDTERVVASFNDKRVIWLPGVWSGRPAVPRNRGLGHSRGDWIAFLDDDDVWLPEKLEKQLVLANKLGCKAVCSNAHRLDPGQGIVGELLAWDCQKITFVDLLNVNQVICSSALVDRSVFEVVSAFPEDSSLKALEDYALWLRVATQTDFAFVAEPLLTYRDDAANSVRSLKACYWRQRGAVLDDFIRWARKSDISPVYFWKVTGKRTIDLFARFTSLLAG